MGLFDFFSRNGQANASAVLDNPEPASLEIPEHVFVAKDAPKPTGEQGSLPKNDSGITLLFAFLERDHQAKGYDDALINPDSRHLEAHLGSLKNELERTIRKVKTFYEDFITEINFHIVSRSRSGMIDTVEELNMKKAIAESHMEKVQEIEEDAKNNRGDSQGILMSYARGFHNGLAAITHHSILNRKF